MSPKYFSVQEHVIEGQYIREYPAATASNQEAPLYLCIKQYTPYEVKTIENQKPITIIGGHANGFAKELYEPFWDDLYERSFAQNFTIGSIWIADVVNQGQSSILNEHTLGNEPNWRDASRDILHMINHFRTQMPRPLIAIGHSMGGAQLVGASLMHPRLFTSMVLFDPVIHAVPLSGSTSHEYSLARMSTFRRDIWASRSEAEAIFRRSPFYQSWDPRVLDLWLEYGLRSLPTRLYPANSHAPPKPAQDLAGTNGPVTLTTTKHQEVWTFLRPNYHAEDEDGLPLPNRKTHADLDPSLPGTSPFYRPETSFFFDQLPNLRPPVLYVFGETSIMSNRGLKEQKLEVTGTGVGGSGGAKEGRVRGETFKGVGHLIPMEAPGKSADMTAEWLGKDLERWRVDEREFEEMRASRGEREDVEVNEEWIERLGGDPRKGGKKGGGRKTSKI
ncbi:hypothetical protein MMC25_007879 [Agyrium rufum]|nr:hypothetical protein [Agyrium rufum]